MLRRFRNRRYPDGDTLYNRVFYICAVVALLCLTTIIPGWTGVMR